VGYEGRDAAKGELEIRHVETLRRYISGMDEHVQAGVESLLRERIGGGQNHAAPLRMPVARRSRWQERLLRPR
jgi:hypothetical protein